MKRVVVTGMSAITALGDDWGTVRERLQSGASAITRYAEWDRFQDLRSHLAAPVTQFEKPKEYSRKLTRSMGRVSLMATRATERALTEAGLLDDPIIQDGRMGVSYGSSSGSPAALEDFTRMLIANSMKGISANTYIKMMAHTAPVNLGVFFGLTGRTITTCSACTSGSQGIGYAFEAIRHGKQKLMVAGGAEELHISQGGIFDTLFATSVRNDEPQSTPRPFDKERDGLVLGEGACTFVLEELEHAQERGARIIAEVVGFCSNTDGAHVTQPNPETMQLCLRGALEDAALEPEAVGYVSAHGTATELGDIAESVATNAVFGSRMPTSSLKSYIGHTLGACGAIEAWASIHMMNDGWFHPTLNLEALDPKCAQLDYLVGQGREIRTDCVMSNNFAFGGINTSLLFRKF